MSHPSVLPARVGDLQFGEACRLVVLGRYAGRPATAGTAKPANDNYLPGLRPVCDEVAAYFGNDFVWYGY